MDKNKTRMKDTRHGSRICDHSRQKVAARPPKEKALYRTAGRQPQYRAYKLNWMGEPSPKECRCKSSRAKINYKYRIPQDVVAVNVQRPTKMMRELFSRSCRK